MYQNEIKENFIKDYMRSRVIAKTSLYSLFRKTEKYEQQLNKDCSEFTTSEVLSMYTEFQAKSVHVLLNYNVILKAYCAWKKYYHDLNEDVAYNKITKNMLSPLVPKSASAILSKEDVIDIEDQLLNWTDKAIIEALFEGLSGKSMRDLVSINNDMINHKTKQIHFPDGRVFDLTDRLYDLLIKSFDETEYMCYGETQRITKLIGKGMLYKERVNAHAADSDDKYFRWVYRKVQNIRKYVGLEQLTMKNIAAAGLVHYIHKGMEQTGLDLKQFLLTEKGEEIMIKYGYYSSFRVENVISRYSQFI